MPIQWREAMAVGDESVDADHRQLIDLINKVELILTAAGGHIELEATLDELGAYTHAHFEREEHLMQCVGYPGLVAHRQAHRELRTQFGALHKAMTAAKAQALTATETSRLVTLLRDWLLDHVLKEDMKVKAFLKK